MQRIVALVASDAATIAVIRAVVAVNIRRAAFVGVIASIVAGTAVIVACLGVAVIVLSVPATSQLLALIKSGSDG